MFILSYLYLSMYYPAVVSYCKCSAFRQWNVYVCNVSRYKSNLTIIGEQYLPNLTDEELEKTIEMLHISVKRRQAIIDKEGN